MHDVCTTYTIIVVEIARFRNSTLSNTSRRRAITLACGGTRGTIKYCCVVRVDSGQSIFVYYAAFATRFIRVESPFACSVRDRLWMYNNNNNNVFMILMDL